MYIGRVKSFNTVKSMASMTTVCDHRHSFFLVQSYTQKYFLLDIKLLHDVNTVTKISIGPSEFVHKFLTTHLCSHLCNLMWTFNSVDPTLEVVFFEVAFSPACRLYLSLYNEFAFIVRAKFSSDSEGLLRIVSHMTQRYLYSVTKYNLGGMILV